MRSAHALVEITKDALDLGSTSSLDDTDTEAEALGPGIDEHAVFSSSA